MVADLMNPDTWATQATETIRRAAADYRIWADEEDRNGFPRLASDMRRMAARLDRLYPAERVAS